MRSSSINNNINNNRDNYSRGGNVNIRKQNSSGIPHAHSEGNDLSAMANDKPPPTL